MQMLKPGAEQAASRDQNYYAYVVGVAKRARDIANDAENNKVILEEKPVQLAVEELANGKTKIDYHPIEEE